MRRRAALGLLLATLPLSACTPARAPRVPRAAAADTGVLVPATSAELVARANAPGARVSVLNVWATWCGPCREEFPALLAVAKRQPEVRLVLVSADFETQAPDVRAFLAAHGVRDTTYLKHEGDQAFINGLDPDWSGALPATLVYDAHGRRTAFWEGSADSTRFEAAIAAAFRSSSIQEATR
jgi:thiol-disulfide isomerase/thioredoxin